MFCVLLEENEFLLLWLQQQQKSISYLYAFYLELVVVLSFYSVLSFSSLNASLLSSFKMSFNNLLILLISPGHATELTHTSAGFFEVELEMVALYRWCRFKSWKGRRNKDKIMISDDLSLACFLSLGLSCFLSYQITGTTWYCVKLFLRERHKGSFSKEFWISNFNR